ncbi:unnamed protein product [Rotaria magnacalcarata]
MKNAFCLIAYLFRSSSYRTSLYYPFCFIYPLSMMHTLMTTLYFGVVCLHQYQLKLAINGTSVSGTSARQLTFPQGIFAHDKTKRLYVSDMFNNRIQIFPLDRSTTTDCTGVWLDKEKKNFYVRYRILKWSSKTNSTLIVAGETGQKEPRANHLNEPQGIYVDSTTQAAYIADLINHRVQKWAKDAKEGVTVAGSSDGDPGSFVKSLDRPYGLRVDEETKIVYVVDLLNNQFQRWKHDENEGDTIAGGNAMVEIVLFQLLFKQILFEVFVKKAIEI